MVSVYLLSTDVFFIKLSVFYIRESIYLFLYLFIKASFVIETLGSLEA